MIHKGRSKQEYFQHVIDKVDNKLTGWKQKLLSIGGRLILVKHVLSAIPIHTISAMKVPAGVLKILESKFSKFTWGEKDGTQKKVWRSWEGMAFPVEENGLGVRRLQDTQLAFGCKLWWKYTNGIGVWAKFMNTCGANKEKLHAWNWMKQTYETCKENIGVLVNDGSSLFWKDNWSGLGPLEDRIQADYQFNPSLRLCDAYQNGRWIIADELLDQFSAADKEVILSFNFRIRGTKDKYVWKPCSTGEFTVSSAFQMLRPKQQTHKVLEYVWEKRIPVKISIFMWRMLNGLLPFPEVLMDMGYSMPSKCPHCKNLDTLQHCMQTCELAAATWNYFHNKLQHFSNTNGDLWNFLESWWFIDEHKGALGKFIQLLPSVICWELWKARNMTMYEELHSSPSAVIKAVLTQLHTITQAYPFQLQHSTDEVLLQIGFVDQLLPKRRKQIQQVVWNYPPPLHYKVNVDGSSMGNPGHAGCGIVVRDHSGTIIAAKSVYIEHQTNMYAEIQALKTGMELCMSLGLQNVFFETDSQMLVAFLRHEFHWPWRYVIQLEQMDQLLQEQSFQLHHIYREANTVADSLAKLASHSHTTTNFTFAQLPKEIQGLLVLDQQQFPYIRIR